MATTPRKQWNAKAGYHQFKGGVGSFCVEWIDDTTGDETGAGWYWYAGFPGCLPDGDPLGPFSSSSAAYADARRD